jgi:hypothetical protein
MRLDTDVDLIRETLGDDRDPTLGVQLIARARLLDAVNAGAGAQPVSTRRSWRPRVILVLAVAAVAAVVIVSRLEPSATQPAWTLQAVERAAAVVIPPPSSRTILHVAATETLSPLARRADATTVASLSEEAWIQLGAPWNERAIVHAAGGPVLEENSFGQIYNMSSNALYPPAQIPSGAPRYTLVPGAHPGTFRLRAKLHGAYVTSMIDAATLRSLRSGTEQVRWAVGWNGHGQHFLLVVVPSGSQLKQLSAQQPNAASVGFAAQLHGLLFSGHARVARTTTPDGRPAIEISSVHAQSGPRTNYYVDPKTYAPIELDSFGYDNPNDVTRLRFSTYETVPLARHQRVLRFTIPATARTDRIPADYWQAAGLPRPF